jgi:hypothetical protein
MIRIIALIAGLMSVCASLTAQNLTLSPYSRFGIGEIFQSTSARSMAMGDIGQATYSYANINRLNPAGYADLLYTTLDVSAFTQASQLKTRTGKENQFTSGFQNVMFGFPSNGPIVLTMGFSPYSAVGYDVSTQYDVFIPDTARALANYTSEGGLNQAFIGVAARFLNHRLKVGLNGNYTFGNLVYKWESLVLNTSITEYSSIRVNEATFVAGGGIHAGIMYTDTLSGKRKGKSASYDAPVTFLRIGGSVDHSFELKGDRLRTLDNNLGSIGILDTIGGGLELGGVTLPTKFGFGVALTQLGHWEISAEATYQNWQSFSYFSDAFSLSNGGLRLAAGGEWIPDITSSKYLNRVAFRAGVYKNDTYLTVDGNDISDVGFTIGLGLPASRRVINQFNREAAYSRINLGFGLGRRGQLKDGLPLEELYFRARVGFTINERWFRQVRVD